MTAFEIISIVIAIISLMIAFAMLIIALLAYIDRKNKRK